MKNWQHEPFYWAPERIGRRWRVFKDSPSPPPAPDYSAAASAQGNANVDTARTQGRLNNPSIISPYGTRSVNYGQSVNGDGYTVNTSNPDDVAIVDSLSPEQQKIYNSQTGISQGLLDTGQTALTRAQQTLSKPLDLSSVNDIYDKAYKAQTARLDPQWQQAQQQQETQLRNQGLVPGGEAYDNAMRVFNQGKNDAYSQAENSAISTMPQTFQLAQAAYNEPLNEVNALRSGNQVQSPTFQQYQGGTVGQTPLFQAAGLQGQSAQNIYNQQVASSNANTSGLYSLGAAGLLALSDRRLKSNIRRIGTHACGLPLYAYEIFGHPDIGVMAQEALVSHPHAVFQHPSGYLMVDYGRL